MAATPREYAALGQRLLAAAVAEVAIEQTVGTVDWVAVRAAVTGTQPESLIDFTPTGRSSEDADAWFCRIEDHRITERWSLPDGLGYMQQLGAIRRIATERFVHRFDQQFRTMSHDNGTSCEVSPDKVTTVSEQSVLGVDVDGRT